MPHTNSLFDGMHLRFDKSNSLLEPLHKRVRYMTQELTADMEDGDIMTDSWGFRGE